MLTGFVTCFLLCIMLSRPTELKRFEETKVLAFDSGEMVKEMFKLLPLCQMPTIAASNESEIHQVEVLPVPPYVFAWQKIAKPVKQREERSGNVYQSDESCSMSLSSLSSQ